MIRKIMPSGVVSTLAGTGAAGATDGVGVVASFNAPSHIAIDGAGNLYVADSRNNKIRKVVTTGYVIDKPLPPGLHFDPTTGTISGTPTVVLSPPIVYNITAYNTAGSSKFTLTLGVLSPDNFAFNPLPEKNTCDADFDPGAVADFPIKYTSGNPAVAIIVGNQIHITGPGMADIIATDSVTSVTQTLTVDPPATPIITISPALLDTCSNAIVTYLATVTDGGTAPNYQWQVNGQNQGTNSSQFTTGNLNNGDKITCTLTSNAICITTASVTSSPAFFDIFQPAAAAVRITSSARTDTVCQGSPVVFTATPFTTDNHPVYQWQVNGIYIGKSGPTFTTNTLADKDVVSCVMTSNSKCLVNPQVSSNVLPITIDPYGTCLIVIPNAFSPNGDGINDLWDIAALQNYPGCTVAIYDRYGTLIYNSTGYPRAWDGTYNGRALPRGTYYYVINPKNGKQQVAGYVTILR